MNILPESNPLYVIRKLELEPLKTEKLVQGWTESFVNMPETIPFLEQPVIDELYEYLKFGQERIEVMNHVFQIIRSNFTLKAYIWHTYYRLFSASFSFGCSPDSFGYYPLPEKDLGENADCAYLAAAFGVVLLAREKYRSMNVPENIIRDTLSIAFGSLVKDPRHHSGGRGMRHDSYSWLRLYAAGRLIQLGRFNFKLMETYPFGLVLQNKKDHRKILLMEPGNEINSRGYYFRDKGLWDNPYQDPYGDKVITTELEYMEDGWKGYPVNPKGFSFTEKMFFPKTEWEAILEPGDSMIDMHIPSGGNMSPELCRDSFKQVFEYFGKLYPGKFKPVIISHSWIFNVQFEDKMPKSNLAKLMRECYLFPYSSCGQDGIYFLYGKYFRPEELPTVPCKTSLCKVMLELAQSPEQLRRAGMLYWAEDLEDFGNQHYRKDFYL